MKEARAAAKQNAARAKEETARAAADKQAADRPPFEILGRQGRTFCVYSRFYKGVAELDSARGGFSPASLFGNVAPVEVLQAWCDTERKLNDRDLAAVVRNFIFSATGDRRYSPDKVRGAGIWRDAEGLIYATGRACYLFPADGSSPVQVDDMRPDGTLYTAENDITGLPAPAAEPLTLDERQALYAFLSARPWRESYAGDYLAGWLIMSLLAGVVPHRSHLYITGGHDCGKTTLFNDLRGVFGAFHCYMDGLESSPAAMKRTINGCALPFMFDEAESGGDKLKEQRAKEVRGIARLSYDGKVVKMADPDDRRKQVLYRLCSPCLFLSIYPMPMEPQDVARFHFLQVRKMKSAKLRELSQAREAGRKLIMQRDFLARLLTYAIQQALPLLHNAAKIQAALEREGHGGRRAEQIGLMLAGRWALTNGGEMPQERVAWCVEVAAAAEENAQAQYASDGVAFIEHLLSCEVYNNPKLRLKKAWLIVRNQGKDDPADVYPKVQYALDAYGIIVKPVPSQKKGREEQWYMVADYRKPCFLRLLKGTPWESGRIEGILEDFPDAEIVKGRFKGGSPRFLLYLYEPIFTDGEDEA